MLVRNHLFVVGVASLGGLLGVIGAFIGEATHPLTDPFIIGPAIEEVMKPFGIYLLLFNWPYLLRGKHHVAFLAAWGGFLFGVIEAIVYVKVYADDPSRAFVIYRFSGPIIMHSASSFVMGLGIDGRLMRAVRGQGPLPEGNLKYLATAVGLHSVYNRIAVMVAASI